ncbi:MAG: HAD family hydrolase [Candidatus Hydrogenedentota bacterium]
MASVEWLLIDVGSVLIIDDYGVARFLQRVCDIARAGGRPLTLEQVMRERETLVNTKLDPAPYLSVANRHLADAMRERAYREVVEAISQHWQAFNTPAKDVREVLTRLARRYHLAIAANQPANCRAALDELGLLRHFEVVGISAEMGIAKPDPAFFTRILEQAGCPPSAAIMIGDRIDNDIAPAKALGLGTIQVRMDPGENGFDPRDEAERAYIESLRRAPARGRGNHRLVHPDAAVTRLADLPAAVEHVALVHG